VTEAAGTTREAQPDGTERLLLHTEAGDILCRHHPAAAGDGAVLWLFGAGGGLGGPAGGAYARLGGRLAPRGIASLELAYRRPARLGDCVVDALFGLGWLAGEGRGRVAVVGHSFGGAVAIAVGATAVDNVVGVAALSSQTAGTDMADEIAPRPLLLIHGEADEILPAACSHDIHRRAGEPKRLILYPGCRHGLDQCREALDRDLTAWIEEVLG
jgi:fermentation-respiration switch protein FrsA (DUF1100 family)